MKRYEGALRRLSILFILINLLSPVTASMTFAEEDTSGDAILLQEGDGTVVEQGDTTDPGAPGGDEGAQPPAEDPAPANDPAPPTEDENPQPPADEGSLPPDDGQQPPPVDEGQVDPIVPQLPEEPQGESSDDRAPPMSGSSLEMAPLQEEVEDDFKVLVCHYTGSATNPFIAYDNIPASQLASGVGHAQPGHQDDRDLWASFTYDGVTYPGRGDQTIVNNYCLPVPVPLSPVTINPAVCDVMPTVNVPPDTENIDYQLTGPDAEGKFTVTAILDYGYIFSTPYPAGWVDGPIYTDAEGVPHLTAIFTGQVTVTPCEPDLSVAKSVVTTSNPNGTTAVPGDTVTYSITVTNSGDGDAEDVILTDQLPAGITWTPSVGSVNESNFLTANLGTIAANGGTVTVTVTGAIPADGSVCNLLENTAVVNGDILSNDVATDIYCDPSLLVTKTQATLVDVDGDGRASAGDTLTYTITVDNNGNVTLYGIDVTDPLTDGANIVGTIAELAPDDAPVDFTVSYTLTQADLDAGEVENCAYATADDGTTDDACVTDNLEQEYILSLLKTAVETSYDAVNDIINYTLVATNDGNTTLHNVGISDPLLGTLTCTVNDVAVTNGAATLLPGESLDCTGSYTVDQDDLDAGSVFNEATAYSDEAPDDLDDETVTGEQRYILSLTKDATEESYDSVGDVINYLLVATNDGNTTLTNVTISDPLLGALDCDPLQPAILLPGETLECTGSYTVDQDDLEFGRVDNTATADSNQTDEVSADEMVPAVQRPAMTFIKTADVETYDAVGDVITYTFTVVNTGNVILPNVTIVDALDGISALSCAAEINGGQAEVVFNQGDSLAPGDRVVCIATYTIDQADLDAGSVTNAATADSDKTEPIDDAVIVIADQKPAIDARKTSPDPIFDANGDGVINAGDTITYNIRVENTGNVTLYAIDVTDVAPGAGNFTWTNTTIASLAPGDYEDFAPVYTLTQADVNAGSIENCVAATAFEGELEEGEDTLEDNCASDTIDQDPDISLIKTAVEVNETDVTAWPVIDLKAGDVVTYEFVATNTGNVTLTNVTILELAPDMLDLTLDCEQAAPVTLDPDDTLTCTADYEVTQADVDAQAAIYNNAQTTGIAPDQSQVSDTDDEKVYPEADGPMIALTKTATAVNGEAVPGDGGAYPVTDLVLGDEVTYTFVAINIGNVTLSNVEITEVAANMLDLTLDCDLTEPVTLAPTAKLTCEAVYEITQADVDAGEVYNEAIATGDYGDTTVNDTDNETVKTLQSPDLTLSKLVNGEPEITVNTTGNVEYTFTVTNSGNVTLYDISIDDDLVDVDAIDCSDADGIQGSIGTLAVGASATCSVLYMIDQAMFDAGEDIPNVATATGMAPNEKDVTSNEDDALVKIEQTPGLSILKTSDVVDEIGLDEVITYTFEVTNTGNVTLNNVVINDSLDVTWEEAYAGGIVGTINPGQTIEVTATYVVTAADVEEGFVLNCATATDGETPSDESCVRDEVAQNPGLAISKVCPDPTTVKRVGDEVSYEVTITNAGDVTIYELVLTDMRDGTFDPVIPDDFSLAPGAEFTTTFTTEILPEDAENGTLDNTVRVDGIALLEGTMDEEDDDAEIPVTILDAHEGDENGTKVRSEVFAETTVECLYDAERDLVIEKIADVVDEDDVVAGTVITYSFKVTNLGDVTLNDVVIVDELEGLVWDDEFEDGIVGTILPDETVIATATYTVTDADVEAGHVLNCAIATDGETESNESCVDVPTDAEPGLAIIKTAKPYKVTKAGEVITYTFVVTNTGNVPLTDVVIEDEMLEAAGVEIPPIGDLAVGESKTVTAEYTVTDADMKLKEIHNTAVATDGETTSEPDTATVKVYHPKPAPAPIMLPNTGSGDDAGTIRTGDIWLAAATMAAILGYGALNLRKRDNI